MRAYCEDDTVFIEVDNFRDLSELHIEVIIKQEDPTALEPMEMEPWLVRRPRKYFRSRQKYEYSPRPSRRRLGPKKYTRVA